MICPSCLKDVPELIGTDEVCPECFLATAEDLIPTVLEDLVEDSSAWGLPECSWSFLPEFAGGCVCDDEGWTSEGYPSSDHPDGEGDAPENDTKPRFRGVPRF